MLGRFALTDVLSLPILFLIALLLFFTGIAFGLGLLLRFVLLAILMLRTAVGLLTGQIALALVGLIGLIRIIWIICLVHCASSMAQTLSRRIQVEGRRGCGGVIT